MGNITDSQSASEAEGAIAPTSSPSARISGLKMFLLWCVGAVVLSGIMIGVSNLHMDKRAEEGKVIIQAELVEIAVADAGVRAAFQELADLTDNPEATVLKQELIDNQIADRNRLVKFTNWRIDLIPQGRGTVPRQDQLSYPDWSSPNPEAKVLAELTDNSS